MSKPRGNTSPADMSLPPHLRGRRRKGRVVATPPAQMDHASSPRAGRQRRDGERWLAAEAARRLAEEGAEIYVLDLKTRRDAAVFSEIMSGNPAGRQEDHDAG